MASMTYKLPDGRMVPVIVGDCKEWQHTFTVRQAEAVYVNVNRPFGQQHVMIRRIGRLDEK